MKKNIRLICLIFIFLHSCKINKEVAECQLMFKNVLEYYVIDYNHFYPGNDLNSLLVYIDNKGKSINKIIIQDYPIELLYHDINVFKENIDSIKFGFYNGMHLELIACPDIIKLFEDFLHLDSNLIRIASEPSTYTDNQGNKLVINEGLTEYEPKLISTFRIKEKIKSLELPTQQIDVKY